MLEPQPFSKDNLMLLKHLQTYYQSLNKQQLTEIKLKEKLLREIKFIKMLQLLRDKHSKVSSKQKMTYQELIKVLRVQTNKLMLLERILMNLSVIEKKRNFKDNLLLRDLEKLKPIMMQLLNKLEQKKIYYPKNKLIWLIK